MIRWKLVFLFLALIGAVFCGLWLFRFFSMKPPRESEVIQRFQVHRASYERLREMLLEDRQVSQIYADEGVGTTDSPVIRKPSEVNFPIDRYNEYVSLLREVGSNAAFKGEGENKTEVCVGVWGAGWAGYTRHIWVCATPHPSNQVASLDAYYHDPNRPHNVFRHIDGDWYLRADW